LEVKRSRGQPGEKIGQQIGHGGVVGSLGHGRSIPRRAENEAVKGPEVWDNPFEMSRFGGKENPGRPLTLMGGMDRLGRMALWRMKDLPTGARYLVCLPLEAEGLRHAFTLKPAGERDCEAFAGPPPGVAAEIGLSDVPLAVPAQVHGAVVARPAGNGSATHPHEADSVIVEGRRGAAAVATADCVAALVHAPGHGAFAVIHAGWRGTLAGALREAVRALAESTGAPASSMTVAMGPAIGRCCYQVDEDVAGPFRAAFGGSGRERTFGERAGRPTLDLIEANRVQARECGVEAERIHAAGICTACRLDLCWSFRAQGKAAGRIWTLAGWPVREGL